MQIYIRRVLALITVALFPVMGAAGTVASPDEGAARPAPMMPPPGHTDQWWTHAAGCEYTRAGRPGEAVWFLRSIPQGAQCPEFIRQKTRDHIYRAPFMIEG